VDLPIEHGDFPELWDSLPGGTVSGWWFGTFGLFFAYIGNFIIPTDELHHFSEGWVCHQPEYIVHSEIGVTLWLFNIAMENHHF